MTRKEFQNLKKGDRVVFQKSGKNNGQSVAVADIWDDGSIVAPNPGFDNKLCVYSYKDLKLSK